VTDLGAPLSEGVERLRQVPALLAVPALVTLLNVGNLRTVLARRGVDGHIGVEFVFPVPIGDLWTFVNVPDAGSGGLTVAPTGVVDPAMPLSIVVVGSVLYLLLYGVLAAGYLGSIQAVRRHGEYDFLANVSEYAPTYVGLSLVILGVGLVGVAVALLVPPLVVLAIPLALAVGYLLWGAWFLVPVADLGAVPALRRSFRLAVSEGDYAVWALAHLVLVGVLSLVVTPIVVGIPVVGVVLGLAFVVPAGFVLTVASLRVIDDLVGRPESKRESDDADETSGTDRGAV